MNSESVAAIIVAAGESSRMLGENKQFALIGCCPVLLRSIIAFDNSKEIAKIVIVSKEDSVDKINSMLKRANFKKDISIAICGKTRNQSVNNGINSLKTNIGYYAIHDGARPLVLTKDIDRVIYDAKKYGAATLGVPVKDSIKVVDKDSFIVDTPDRQSLYIAQTPQVIREDIYKLAWDKAKSINKQFSDDVSLVSNMGHKVFLTLGSYSNIKITTPEDIKISESLIN